ncbi:M20/M25/M40 family metallo-hydrolase [Patescibacteria group bacterium]|nr:M20/M25/M40 family metallo-hydrolase [Patescibacteria group bacterium]
MHPTISLLEQLVYIESTHERKEGLKEVVDFIASLFQTSNFYVTKYFFDGYPALVVSNTESLDVDIILSGHLDVVGAPKKMFTPKVKDGYMYGRGTMDMKSGVAAMINSFRATVKDTKHTIALLLSTDEEIGGFNGAKQLLETVGYTGKIAIIPDGGYKETQIALREKGFLRAHITFSGLSAHASRPWQGDNAILKMADFIHNMEEYNQSLQKNDSGHWYTTVNLSRCTGGHSLNSVPNNAVVDYDIRYTEDQAPEGIIESIKKLAEKYSAEVHISMLESNVCISKDNPYVQQYVASIEANEGKVTFTQDQGASDARFFVAHGVPVVLSQPYGLDWHSPNERVDLDSVLKFQEIVTYFIRNFEVKK